MLSKTVLVISSEFTSLTGDFVRIVLMCQNGTKLGACETDQLAWVDDAACKVLVRTGGDMLLGGANTVKELCERFLVSWPLST